MNEIKTDNIAVEVPCVFCPARPVITVSKANYRAWQNGMLAQKAFPQLTATEREVLISHICPICQKKIFG